MAAIYIHQKALKDAIWGPVFNKAKVNTTKIKGHEKETLDVEKPHTTQDPWSEGV